jgi:hypothetical protein
LRKGIINASGETRRLLEDYRKALKPGETIAKLEWDHAVTSTGREVSRRALSLMRKESYSPFSDDQLIAKDFKPMRDPNADERPRDDRIIYSEQRG